MGRLAGFAYRDVHRVALLAGWQHRHSRGSHAIYAKAGALRPLVVPTHRELRESTLHAIVRQMGLTVAEFLELVRR